MPAGGIEGMGRDYLHLRIPRIRLGNNEIRSQPNILIILFIMIDSLFNNRFKEVLGGVVMLMCLGKYSLLINCLSLFCLTVVKDSLI